MTPEISNPSTRCHSRPGRAVLRLVIALAVIAGLSVAAIAYFNRSDSGKGEESALYAVRTMDFDITLTATGELRASRETVLRSRLETTVPIVEIVDEGITVEAGDLLVRLSDDEIRQRLENETLTLETARSELVSAENALEIQRSDNDSNLRAANLRLQLSEIAFEKWEKGEDEEQRKQLALNIEAAERELERLEEKFENSRMLLEANFLSRDQFKQDELALLRAEADLERARLRSDTYHLYEREMKRVELESEIREATAELDRVKRRNESEIASRLASVTNARQQVAIRQARVEKLEEQIAASVVRAPTAGLVVYATSLGRNSWRRENNPLGVGTQVSPNEEILVLPNNEEMIAAVNIHESLVGQIQRGQPARVRIDARRGKVVEGVIDGVGVLAQTGGWRDPNLRQYEVRIRLNLADLDHDFKPSMRSEGEIIVGRVTNALAVPVEGIFFEDGVAFVYTPRDGRYAPVPVTIGRRSSIFAEVTRGLSEGDRILLRQPRTSELWIDPTTQRPAVARAPQQPADRARPASTTDPDDQTTATETSTAVPAVTDASTD